MTSRRTAPEAAFTGGGGHICCRVLVSPLSVVSSKSPGGSGLAPSSVKGDGGRCFIDCPEKDTRLYDQSVWGTAGTGWASCTSPSLCPRVAFC